MGIKKDKGIKIKWSRYSESEIQVFWTLKLPVTSYTRGECHKYFKLIKKEMVSENLLRNYTFVTV